MYKKIAKICKNVQKIAKNCKKLQKCAKMYWRKIKAKITEIKCFIVRCFEKFGQFTVRVMLAVWK